MLLFAGCSKSTEPDISTGHEVTLEDMILERDLTKAHIEQLKIDYHEKEQELQDIHKQADELREYINDLNEAIY
jgi:septal ring factor EnvC (AmiA/AmiB activator)